MASISLFIGRLCSICSISAWVQQTCHEAKPKHVLVMFSSSMSSSLTTLSTSFLLASSSTKTFHYRQGCLSMHTRYWSRVNVLRPVQYRGPSPRLLGALSVTVLDLKTLQVGITYCPAGYLSEIPPFPAEHPC